MYPFLVNVTPAENKLALRMCKNKNMISPRLSEEKIAKLFESPREDYGVLTTLSVRSSFDLFLQVKNFPPGSEIICTCINIPDMCTLIKEHKLVPVSIDYDPYTLNILPSELERVYKKGTTVAIMVAHVFGCVTDMEEAAKFSQKHGLSLIEDAAEAFNGCPGNKPEIDREELDQCTSAFGYTGHQQSEITFFSFGAIKHCSAYSGAVSIVRNNVLFE